MNTAFSLEQSMRWYGPGDPVSLQDIAQAGCTHVVSALHDIPVGEVWPCSAIEARQQLIREAGLKWTVVESLPVHEDIKSQSGDFLGLIERYRNSLVNLAKCGIKVVTYNFMPIFDWLRTDVAHLLPNRSEALAFNRKDYAVFDLFMLNRPGAEDDYSHEEADHLKEYFASLDDSTKSRIYQNVLLGLPGSDVPFTPEQILHLLEQYRKVDRDRLKRHLFFFLEQIIPVAEVVGIRLAIHPDDPPFPVLGLPRIVSTAEDIKDLITAVPSPANGLCFCTGSLGARPDNDLLEMLRKWGRRVYFLHLRNTSRDEEGNFTEANHLEGQADMYGIMKEVVALMQRDQRAIPMRPDHGHKMLDDLAKTTYPGYSAIGRLKGLAELRGLEYGIRRSMTN